MMEAGGKPFVLVSIGATGSGKSYKVKSLLKEQRPPRILVWDMNREYSAILGNGALTTRSLAEVERWLMFASKPEFRAHRFAICYQPPEFDEQLMARAFKRVCARVLEAQHVFFVLDEAHEVLQPGMGNERLFRTIVTRGRHRHIKLAVITQRPALIDKTSLSNATTVRCFKLTDPNDVRYMASSLGLQVAEIDALKAGEYFERDTDTKKISRLGVPIRGAGGV